MQIVGMIANRANVMTEAEIAAVIDGKSGRVIRAKFLEHCARFIIGHNGVNTGGGCPAHVTFQGRAVFHDSHGQRGNGDGCTVFFTSAALLGGPDIHATAILLAVGRHDQDVGGQPHYALDWTRTGWFQGNGIQF